MIVKFKFTDADIEHLKMAKDALHQVACEEMSCGKCPLFIGNGCMVNHLGSIIKKAEDGRAW